MKFELHQFSKRFPPLECAVIVLHDPPRAQRGTGAAIVLPNGRAWLGVAICADGDTFVKATGRQKAIGRAFRSYMKRGESSAYDPADEQLFSRIIGRLKVELLDRRKQLETR
jgi:hypothetical protein